MPVTRQHLKDLASLSRRKGRLALGQFLVEGVRSVESAVEGGAPLVEILVTPEAEPDARVAALAARAGVPVASVTARDLERVGDAQSSQGVVAVSRTVVADHVGEAPGRVLVLDGVQDPGNVGALVRTAAWFGVDTVLADQRSADFEGPKAVRAAMGGLWDVGLVRVADLDGALDTLDARGLTLWGADLDGTPLADWQDRGQAVLVLGSEAHGLSDSVRARLAGCVSIPGGGSGVESLNVAVAGGILMHAWRSGRGDQGERESR